MALLSVSLAETLRPWRTAGVFHFLGSEGTMGIADPAALAEADPLPVPRVPIQANTTASPPVPPAPPTRAKAGSITRPAEDSKPAAPNLPPVEAWPAPWAALWAKTLSTPKVVWVYPELGQDLCGTPEPARRDFLRTLLKELNLPAGTNAFWPYSLPETTGALVINQAVFMAGLAELKPRVVVFFGPLTPAQAGLTLSIQTPFCSCVQDGGRLFVLLPALENSIHQQGTARQILGYLHSALAGIIQNPQRRG